MCVAAIIQTTLEFSKVQSNDISVRTETDLNASVINQQLSFSPSTTQKQVVV
jgi:hypothetical protein